MPPANFRFYNPNLIAQIDGNSVEITGFQASFEVNAIPKATITIPMGIAMKSGIFYSYIYPLLNNITINTPVEVYEKTVPLFKGYAYSAGIKKSGFNVSFVLHINHWMSDLNFSSLLSRLLMPSNASDYGLSAIPTDEFGAQFNAAFPARIFAEQISKISDGVWAFIQSSVDAFSSRENIAELQGLDCKNNEAVNALNKFEEGASTRLTDSLIEQGLDEAIAEWAVDIVAAHGFDWFANQTAWQFILYMIKQFMIAIAPGVDRAVVYPYVPGLNQIYRSVSADEITFVNLESPAAKPYAAVILLVDTGLAYGATPSSGPITTIPGGIFFARPGMTKDDLCHGLIMFRKAPGWMSKAPSLFEASGDELNVRRADNIANALNPGGDGDRSDTYIPEIIAQAASGPKILHKLARVYMVAGNLQGRQGIINTNLRFDIMPGSTVMFQVSKGLLGEPLSGTNIIAQVGRVTITIDAEAKRAGTGFHIINYRTMAESSIPSMSLNTHPLFDSAWPGDRLL